MIIFVSRETALDVGKLGRQVFPKGYYTYTGSALGKGASSLKRRIVRHLQKKKSKFYHVDFLLTNENARVKVVVVSQTEEKLECSINYHIKNGGEGKVLLKGFGASDCKENCESHLFFFPDLKEEHILVQKIIGYYKRHFSALRSNPIDIQSIRI